MCIAKNNYSVYYYCDLCTNYYYCVNLSGEISPFDVFVLTDCPRAFDNFMNLCKCLAHFQCAFVHSLFQCESDVIEVILDSFRHLIT